MEAPRSRRLLVLWSVALGVIAFFCWVAPGIQLGYRACRFRFGLDSEGKHLERVVDDLASRGASRMQIRMILGRPDFQEASMLTYGARRGPVFEGYELTLRNGRVAAARPFSMQIHLSKRK